jgi:hypothetical protein
MNKKLEDEENAMFGCTIFLCLIVALIFFTCNSVDAGRIKRSHAAKSEFLRSIGVTNGKTPPGYVVDHIIPLKRGGCDCPQNMQLQDKASAKAKDKWE